MQDVLSNISNSVDLSQAGQLTTPRENINRVLIIVVTSNKGLCGAFNSNVVKKSIQTAEEDFSRHLQNDALDIIAIGKRGNDLLKSKKFKIIQNQSQLFDALNFDTVQPIADEILGLYMNGTYDAVMIIYNQFRNAAVQNLMVETLLPISLKKDEETLSQTKNDFIFEPDEESIINDLIPRIVRINFYKALLDSNASEHGARMTAMHKATDNATELISELKLFYNKARQASITNEILEIVGGAEALKS